MMNEKEIKELSKMITNKLISKIFIKLNELEMKTGKEIEVWNFDDENLIVFGEFKDGEYFEEKIGGEK